MWKYNIASNTWTQIDTTNGPSVRYMSAVFNDNQGNTYLFGGAIDDSGTSLNDLWKLSN
jgi:hypothetical protein